MEATELLIQRIQSLENEVRDMKDNHLHDLEIRLERIDTTLKIGWKIVSVVNGAIDIEKEI